MLGLAFATQAAAQTTFQPAFHQALRWSESTGGTYTYRLKVPVGKAGSRLRLHFRAGDGALQIHRVTVGRAVSGSTMAAAPVQVKFGGNAGISAQARQRVTSDAVSFPVAFGEELFVSFEAQGALSTSAILALPGSFRWSGNHATALSAPAGSDWYRAVGLSTIEVEGPRRRSFVAIGDSITEGYVGGDMWTYSGRHDDYRGAWTTVAQNALKMPVANAAVSGQGVDGALDNLDEEVLALSGVSDCLLLIGTNDLGGIEAQALISKLQQLATRLQPMCTVWHGTLLPKETTSSGTLSVVNARRGEVNAWIRQQSHVVDFESAVKKAGTTNDFQTGYTEDGVHPSVEGQLALGNYVGRFFTPPPVNIAANPEPTVGKAFDAPVEPVNPEPIDPEPVTPVIEGPGAQPEDSADTVGAASIMPDDAEGNTGCSTTASAPALLGLLALGLRRLFRASI